MPNQTAKKEELKTMAMAGTGIINSQIPNVGVSQPKAYYGAQNGISAVGNYDSQKPSQMMNA